MSTTGICERKGAEFTKEARGRNGMYHVAEEDRIRLDGREDP